jgi:hypothetical protein
MFSAPWPVMLVLQLLYEQHQHVRAQNSIQIQYISLQLLCKLLRTKTGYGKVAR